MKQVILLKCGELTLKGMNRRLFEDALIRNCRARLRDMGSFKFSKAQSTIYVEPNEENVDLEEAADRLGTVFGIAALTHSYAVEKDFDEICRQAPVYLRDALTQAKTFKVEARRADKKFPMNSPQICMELGGRLLEQFPHLTVDVHHPQVTVYVEIRETAAYIHTDQIPGAGGLPVGTSGNAMLLVSGGIDSPVAGYMMAKRGLRIRAIHFISPPYTGEHALEKVKTLCRKISVYTGPVKLLVVPFTKVQEAIRDNCPEELSTVIMRRIMMQIASHAAQQHDCGALITGESVAQVASQTIQAIACTDDAAALPVLRPVIGMDKNEIIKIARQIDTFETSVLPYEDCCTVFTPKHPKTRPNLEAVKHAQALVGPGLIEDAISGIQVVTIE